MRIKHLALPVILVLPAALPCMSDGQNTERLRYVPSRAEIAAFFQGKISESNAHSIAVYNARYLHLMDERPLVETAEPPATQVYRLLLDTLPYGIPAVVRLSIAPDGSGEVVGKIGHSPRFPDVLNVNRTAKVSKADIDEFLKLLEESDFWSLPVFERIDTHHVVMGEPGWMLEGNQEGSYQVVCRGTSSLGSLSKPVMFLVNLSKLDLASTTIRPRFLTEVWCGGDDGLTVRLRDALESEFKSSSLFALSSGKKPGTLVATIPTHVGWKQVGKRTRVFYTVNFSSIDNQALGTSTGSCWDDALRNCASGIVKDAEAAARRVH